MNQLDFKGRSAIVTGAAQGIGLEVTQRILGSGGTVCLWDLDADLLAKTVESLGPSAHAVTADIGIAESVAAATTE
ncbi:MAG: SDR family NAD(P)-dependent oxidoreductase, partial [Pseudomonadota bacterium]